MLLVKLYINGQKDRVRHTTDVLARNNRVVRDKLGDLFGSPTQSVIIVPLVIAGKDISLSKNMPDVLFEITSYRNPLTPNAKVTSYALIESCVDLETLHLHILVTNRSDSTGSNFHRPEK